jgi:quercetin dioxygenase-like cupin family protein
VSHGSRMRSLVVVVLVGVAAAFGSGAARAQDATPTAGGVAAPVGVAFQPLGVAAGVTLPVPADLTMARAGFDPGATFAFEASDPEGSLLLVESGELTIRVEEQAWTVSRGAALDQAMANATEGEPDTSGVMEEVAMGQEATLRAGDVAYIPGNLTGEVRNDGQEPASALLVVIEPARAMTGGEAEATPAG